MSRPKTVPDRVVREIRERFAANPHLEFMPLAQEYGVTDVTIAHWIRGTWRADAGGPTSPVEPRRARRATHWSFDYEVTESGCWNWAGSIDSGGYGRTRIAGTAWLAHRLAWTITHGPIPGDLTVDHICWNTRCVNPEHLQLLTLRDNVARRRPRTECRKGHALEGENLRRSPSTGNRRICVTCDRARHRKGAS